MPDDHLVPSARIGIVVTSDRASAGVYHDLGGPAIRDTLRVYLTSPWSDIYRLIADDQTTIENTLIELCDRERCDLVVTTGGTGPAPRDVTPEATAAVCQRMMPGFWRINARGVARLRPHRDFITSNGRHPWIYSNY